MAIHEVLNKLKKDKLLDTIEINVILLLHRVGKLVNNKIKNFIIIIIIIILTNIKNKNWNFPI
jgi:hypothetical protein